MPATDRMPTAGRAVATILMAALAWQVSEMVRPLMPEGTDFGWFNEVNVVLGLLCGWIVTGSRLGRGLSEGIGAGLTGVGALVFWAIFLHSFNEMLGLALENRYDGPVEGLTAVFEIALEYGKTALRVPIVALLVTGGVGIGIVAELVARRLR